MKSDSAAAKTNTIESVLRRAARRLSDAGIATAHLDARLLLRNRMQLSDSQLIAHSEQLVSAAARKSFTADIARRQNGEPISYIIGRREFMGLEFLCAPAALSPRPETEELTEAALLHIPAAPPRRVLDLGTGSGVIGLSIARFRPQSRVLLADESADALALAKKNAHKLHADNASFCRSDWWQNITGTFDFIASNPPYIAQHDDALATLQHEPPMALCGGKDGLSAISIIVAGADKHLRAGGVLMIEHGESQQAAVRSHFVAAGFCGIRCQKDLAGKPRITFGVRP